MAREDALLPDYAGRRLVRHSLVPRFNVRGVTESGSALQKAGRGDDGDALKRVQGKEVFVTGYDNGGAAVYGEFKKFVVPGITAGSNRVGNRNQLRYAAKEPEKLLAVFNADVTIEFGPGENIGEFD